MWIDRIVCVCVWIYVGVWIENEDEDEDDENNGLGVEINRGEELNVNEEWQAGHQRGDGVV